MALTYLSSTLSEDEYLDQRFKQATGTGRVTRAAINNSKYFCKSEYNRELIVVMADIREEVLKTQHMDTALLFLQKLVTWSSKDHTHIITTPNACHTQGRPYHAKDLDTIVVYLSQMRLYMKKVAGIPITAEDIKDYGLSFPPAQDKEEAEPLLPEEFRMIVDNESDFKRRMMYRVMKDCEARIGAMVQLRKKHFNTTTRPIEVTFPKSIVKKNKGRSVTNVKYIIKEDEDETLKLLDMITDDDELVFGTNEDKDQAVSNEEQVWGRKVPLLGFPERYAHNNHLKKNIHSIKAMTFTAAEEAVGLTYAHAYGDHAMYTKTYLRWTYEKKIQKFRMLERHISIYTKTVEIHDAPEVMEKNKKLEDIILQLAEEKKASTRVTPNDDVKEIMLSLLKEHKIIE